MSIWLLRPLLNMSYNNAPGPLLGASDRRRASCGNNSRQVGCYFDCRLSTGDKSSLIIFSLLCRKPLSSESFVSTEGCHSCRHNRLLLPVTHVLY